ncbi:NAD(P)-binding protein [Cupriavidus basilensis]
MDRRRFLIAGAGTAGLGLLSGCDRLGDDASRFLAGVGLRASPRPSCWRPGMAEGHALRDAASWPSAVPAQDGIVTDVAILGGGVAGLSAAWQPARGGLKDFVLVDGPEFGGNAAGGNFGGDLAFPRGAHYLPLPSPESTHIREMLADTGVIRRDLCRAAGVRRARAGACARRAPALRRQMARWPAAQRCRAGRGSRAARTLPGPRRATQGRARQRWTQGLRHSAGAGLAGSGLDRAGPAKACGNGCWPKAIPRPPCIRMWTTAAATTTARATI